MEKAQIIPSQLTICVERITQSIATVYLATSTGNRNITTNSTNGMIKEFSSDNWIADSGQGLTFDVDGELVDGHTRLHTFINSDYPYIDITVVRGVNKLAKLIFDTGRKRTPTATLAIHGIKHANRVAVILSMYVQHKNDKCKGFQTHTNLIRVRKNGITNATIMRVYNEHKATIDKYATSYSKYSNAKCQLSVITPRIFSFLGYILFKNANNYSKVFDLIDTMYLGVNADAKLANYRNAIMQMNTKSVVSDSQKIDLAVRMILYVTGRTKDLHIPKPDSELNTIDMIENIVL